MKFPFQLRNLYYLNK